MFTEYNLLIKKIICHNVAGVRPKNLLGNVVLHVVREEAFYASFIVLNNGAAYTSQVAWPAAFLSAVLTCLVTIFNYTR